MKFTHSPLHAILGAVIAAALFCSGCASTDSSKQASSQPEAKPVKLEKGPPLPNGVELRKEKDLTGVWLAPGFNFSGHPALTIEPTTFSGMERPNEAEMRAFAVKELRDQQASAIRDTGVFSAIATDTPASGDAPKLRLVNNIIEFEKGGGGARYWAGLYGAGQPVLRVRGLMYDANNNLVFVYEAKRSGDSGSARVFGGFRSDKGIQNDDIHDLAIDLAAYIKRAAGQ